MNISPVAGAVFKDHHFAFTNSSEIAIKYIVVLCDSILEPQYVLAIRTTSKERGKPREPSCHQNHKPMPPSSFYVGVQPDIFPIETWLMLDYVTEYEVDGFRNNDRFEHLGMLDEKLTAEILICASQNRSELLENHVIKSINDQINLFKKSGIII